MPVDGFMVAIFMVAGKASHTRALNVNKRLTRRGIEMLVTNLRGSHRNGIIRRAEISYSALIQ